MRLNNTEGKVTKAIKKNLSICINHNNTYGIAQYLYRLPLYQVYTETKMVFK